MKNDHTPRSPSAMEQAILRNLLTADFPGREDLAVILSDIRVRTIDECCSLEIVAGGGRRAQVVKQIPVEGYAIDTDGVEAHVLLHVREGLPYELEIFKDDGSPISSLDVFSNMEVMVLPPHPSQGSSGN